MAVVIVITSVTAKPKPLEDFISFEIDINEHIPRKFVRRILLVKIDAKNNTKGFISGTIIVTS